MQEIERFGINISDDEIADLERRFAATHSPEAETVDDWSQRIALAYVQ